MIRNVSRSASITLRLYLLTEMSLVRCEDKYYLKRTLTVEATTLAFDIITDLMSKSIFPVSVRVLTYLVLIIPPWLLWKVKISLSRKIGIGSFLCLSLIMIIIVIIRISRVHASDFEIWGAFWQHIEACVAVLMLSLTALRTLYVPAKKSQQQQKNKTSYSHRKHLWPSSKMLQHESYIRLGMPRATLTDVRAVVPTNHSISWPREHEHGQDLDTHSDDVSLSVLVLIGMTDSPLSPLITYGPQPSTSYKVVQG